MKKEAAQLEVGDKAPAFRAVAVGGEYDEGREYIQKIARQSKVEFA